MFHTQSGRFTTEHANKKASTAYTVGMLLVRNDTTGEVEPATATSDAATFVGVCLEGVDASDATTREIAYAQVGHKHATILCDSVAGDASTKVLGKTYDVSDANSANVGASSINCLRLVRIISATKAEFEIVREDA